MEALVGSALWTTAGGTAIGTTGLIGAAGSVGLGGTLFSATAGSLLTGLMTGASAFSQIHAGNMNAKVLSMQAEQSTLNARMETLKGRQQALLIKKQLDRDLASQNATFAARGVLTGEGSADRAAATSAQNAEEDINIAQFGATMGSESDKLQASQFRAEGRAAKSAGRMEAMATIAGSRTFRNLGGSLLESL